MSNIELDDEGYTTKFGSEELDSSGERFPPKPNWFVFKQRLFRVGGNLETLSDLL
jgi:hypothetical protein